MTNKEIIKVLQKLNPKERCVLNFQETNIDKTFEPTAIEVKDDKIYIHGHISIAVYNQICDYDYTIAESVCRNIDLQGSVYAKIRALVIETIKKRNRK